MDLERIPDVQRQVVTDGVIYVHHPSRRAKPARRERERERTLAFAPAAEEESLVAATERAPSLHTNRRCGIRSLLQDG